MSDGSDSNSSDDPRNGERDQDLERGTAVDYDEFDALPGPERAGSEFEADGAPDPDAGTDVDASAPQDRESGARARNSASSRESTADRAGPLGDLAAAVDDRSTETDRDGTDDAFDDLFEREDVTELDPDRLWERLEEDDPLADQYADDREIREIDKHEYCHRCEHFADPPAVGCTREGTDILELTTLDTFRVADCPVVLEDEDLERRY
ncbi:hypothetical protein [Halopiger thermotolerans]